MAMMDACQKHPNSFCPSDNLDGMLSWGNTTEGQDGGDERLMFYLQGVGAHGAVPDSICPYSPTPGWIVERQCAGLDEARAANPLSFRVKGIQTLYARDEIKATLRATGRPVPPLRSEPRP